MRKLEFKGFDKIAQSWICGGICYDADIKGRTDITTNYNEVNEVESERIGEWTGLVDKDGNKVYENDIVEAWSQGSFLPNGIIKYGKGSCKFFITNIEVSLSWNLSGSRTPYGFKDEHLKVIGNTYDKALEEKIKEKVR